MGGDDSTSWIGYELGWSSIEALGPNQVLPSSRLAWKPYGSKLVPKSGMTFLHKFYNYNGCFVSKHARGATSLPMASSSQVRAGTPHPPGTFVTKVPRWRIKWTCLQSRQVPLGRSLCANLLVPNATSLLWLCKLWHWHSNNLEDPAVLHAKQVRGYIG